MSSPEWALRPVRGEDVDAMQALVRACFEEYRAWAHEGWTPPTPRRDPREKMKARLAAPAAGGRVAEAARSRLGDQVRELVTDGPATLLVRPDGHLAWRGTEPARLRRWLAGTLDR